MISQTIICGKWHYSRHSLNEIFFPRTGTTLEVPLYRAGLEGEWLEHASLVKFLKSFGQDPHVSDICYGVLQAIQKESVRRRRVSQLRRWDLAYRQEYRCAGCGSLLRPSFEVDHIVELCDGGKDEESNLQCLCRNCHGSKTRASRQRRSKYF